MINLNLKSEEETPRILTVEFSEYYCHASKEIVVSQLLLDLLS